MEPTAPESRRWEYARILRIVENALRERSRWSFPWQYLIHDVRQRIARGAGEDSPAPMQEAAVQEVRSRVLALCDDLLVTTPTGYLDPIRKLVLVVEQWAREEFTAGPGSD